MPDYKNSDMCHAIEEYIRNPKYRYLLFLRFCQGETYEEISGKTNYSVQHVKHIVRTYKDYLINHL